MKKKIFKAITAFICVAATAATMLAGCGGTHEHTLVEYTTDSEATCKTPGKKHAACEVCGEVVEEEIPTDENAHDFTGMDWQITPPTEEATGTATRTCALDSSHVVEVTLPVITASGTGYKTSERTVAPSVTREGKQTLVYASDYGDIEFEVTLPQREIESLDDLIEVASSLNDTIRTSEGTYKEARTATSGNAFSTYFGDDYTSVEVTEGNTTTKSWYSYDEDGDIFAVSKTTTDGTEGEAKVVANANENDLLGFHYQGAFVSTATFYGAEAGLKQIYEAASSGDEAGNSDIANFQGTYTQNRNKTYSAAFSFGKYENPYYAYYTVNLETFKSGAIKSLDIEVIVIHPYMIAEDEAGNKLFYSKTFTSSKGVTHYENEPVFAPEYPMENGAQDYEYENGRAVYVTDSDGNPVYLTDADGTELTSDVVTIASNGGVTVDGVTKIRKRKSASEGDVTAYYSKEHESSNYRTISFTQTEKSDDDVVEENPYSADSLYVHDFNISKAVVYSNGSTISAGKDETTGRQTLTLPVNGLVYLYFENPEAPASFATDPVKYVYAVDENGTKVTLDDNSLTNKTYPILASTSSSIGNTTGAYGVRINSHYAGKVTLLFVTQSGKCEKYVDVTFTQSAPASLDAKAYIYDDTTGYEDTVLRTVTDETVTIYVGQVLQVTTEVGNSDESSYSSPAAAPYNTDSNLTVVSDTENNLHTFSSDTAGTYTITLRSALDSGVSVSFTLEVKEAPDVAGMLAGKTYTGSLTVPVAGAATIGRNITCVFTTAEIDGETKNVINVTIGKSSGSDTAVYTYSVTNNALVATYYSGADETANTAYDFEFGINEAYALTITHNMSISSSEKTTEKIVLHTTETSS